MPMAFGPLFWFLGALIFLLTLIGYLTYLAYQMPPPSVIGFMEEAGIDYHRGRTFLCRLGFHKWLEVGRSDQLFYGKFVPFSGEEVLQNCLRCGLWRPTNLRTRSERYFRAEDQTPKVRWILGEARRRAFGGPYSFGKEDPRA